MTKLYKCLALGLLGWAFNASAATYNGHTYFLTPNMAGWISAEAYAVSQGGHLVTINDAAEQAWLFSQWGTAGNLWIGANDIATEGTWTWISGEPFGFSAWAGGEPNNSGNEDAAVMNWTGAGLWNDLPVNIERFGIVEIAPSPGVPDVGSSAALLLLALGGLSGLRRSAR